MPGPGVAMVSASWLIHSSWDLWLPWLGVVRGAPGLMPGARVAGRGAGPLLNQLFTPLPIKIRKAGVKSHFENLLLSVADALETTLLTRLIAKCKLIVCTGH